MDNLITFIIPTIGRPTLTNTICSLKNQNIKNWNAIIIFDGLKSNIDINNNTYDERIRIVEIKKKGLGVNSAGLVRNYGMSLVKTKWIAFLDDDDTIVDNYIELFYKELKEFSTFDVLLFRMNSDERIIPKLDCDNFYLCDVGISFIIKKSIYDNGLLFTADGAEDFLYLDNIRKNNYNIMISPYITYFVRSEPKYIEHMEGSRVFINFTNNYINAFGYSIINYYFS